ncbi:MAG: ribbon-helix-helix protein, CopG family [Candidatus Binatia bacterium]
MVKTTLYLPEELKAALERAAAERDVSEASLIREALTEKVESFARPRPTVPLFPQGLGDPRAAERVDELLEGFGR